MRRHVAVKVLQGEKAKDPKALERFHREARAAAALDHPNIVRAFDVGQEDRFHYLVMEYVDGQSLRQLVKSDGPLSATLAADYLRQCALGLNHAHEAGLVHRDIKPSNLMVDREGVVKILDLGLARFFEDEGDVLTMGAVLGNADYIAPEQAADSHSVDIRADIYSLGATFWYALTGNRAARSGMEFLRRPGRAAHTPPERTDVPDEIWGILRKMMAPHPVDRYQMPMEVAEAIMPWAPDEAARLLLVETPPAPAPAPTVETTAILASAETITDHPTAPVAPSQALAAKAAPKSKPVVVGKPASAGIGPVSRRPRIVLAAIAGIILAAALIVTRGHGHSVVPGRISGSAPYFKPVTPHSP
jgi:eukaryotic-like serine/threonine-protein kinase